MTRINCIPPSELTDKHLIAEYRELPRIFKLARLNADIPETYRLGKGHVTFFYNKLLYLQKRQAAIIAECLNRGFNIKYTKPPSLPIDKPELCNDWKPTKEAIAINKERINDRLTQSRMS